MSMLDALRDYAAGRIDESAYLSRTNGDPWGGGDEYLGELEEDAEFMSECYDAALPLVLESMVLGDLPEDLDESVRDAIFTLQGYLIENGMLTEATASDLKNKRVSVVKMSIQAQINRLSTIICIKMGRKKKTKEYKKYKFALKIKKTNLAKMKSMFGWKDGRARKMAVKIWRVLYKNKKVQTQGNVIKVEASAKKKTVAA